MLVILESNPCASANCSHLCVLKPLNQYQCLCPLNTTIQEDGRTCNARKYRYKVIYKIPVHICSFL